MSNCEENILVVNASPRKKSNTQILVDEAVKGIEEIRGARATVFCLAGKKINGCKGICRNYCIKNGNCVQADDFHEFANLWMKADGIIYATPVYHMSFPSRLQALIERLGQVFFGVSKGQYLRFCKAGGVIAQGHTQYGGQEYTIEAIIRHLMLMNCIPVSGDMPCSYVGVGAQQDDMKTNEAVKESARSLGRRVTEIASVLKFGIVGLKNDLPSDYFYDHQRKFTPPRK